VPPVSTQSPWGGYTMPVILALLGVFGLIVDTLFLLAFFIVLAYYLYRIEKRISSLEGNPAGQRPKSKQDQPSN